MILCFFLFALKQVNAVVAATTSMIHSKYCVLDLDVVKNLNVKCSIQCQELIKQDVYNGLKRVTVNVDLTVVFVIINNVGMMINAGVNAKN